MPRVKRTLPGFDLREALRDVAVDRAQAIGPQIYEGLRRLIIRSRLPSGAPLHESDIAGACNISRTPVRAALHQLALEGLVTTWPQVGSVVASIDRAEIEAGVVIRRALEGEVVRLLCAASPGASFWPRIEALLEAQRAAVERGDDYAFFAADEQFHAALAEAAGVPAAWRLVHSVKAHIDRVRLLATRLQPRRYQDAYEEHLAILAAVRRGQSEDAAREMARHVEAVLNSFDLLAATLPTPGRGQQNAPPDGVGTGRLEATVGAVPRG